MRGRFATALGLLLLAAQPALAGPPPICRLDPVTSHGISEMTRAVARHESEPIEDGFSVRTIVLDPGHGGSNDGAVGVAALEEKHLTLQLAYALRDEIERRHPGVQVLLTRYWDRDVELPDRIEWANAVNADLFVSLHYNAATHDRAVGYETYFLAEDVLQQQEVERGNRARQPGTPQQKRARRHLDNARLKAGAAVHKALLEPHSHSQILAAAIQAELATRLVESPDRGVKSANFAVLRGALMPAVVVESGFLTHPFEGIRVVSDAHRQHVVQSLADAIDTFEAQVRPEKAGFDSVAATKSGASQQSQQQ